MLSRPVRLSLRLAVSLGALAGITALFTGPISANPTTVALSYLLMVLLVATEWGMVEATVLAVTASFSFNLFFLPPVGVLVIADPENWVSFLAFVITAIVVSQLSGRARTRHVDAVSRQRDLERLYTLSRGLLLADESMAAPAGIARHIAEAFDLESLALYDHHSGRIARAGRVDLPEVEEKLREVARQAVTLREPSGLVVTAIRLGGAPIGSLALMGEALSDTVLQSVVNLAAIGLERAREREAAALVDAAQRSGALRTALLDSVAHELKTPLTSIRAAVSGLAGMAQAPANPELLAVIDEESARLQSLVTDAIQMFRVEAGDFHLTRDRHGLRELVDRTIREIEPRCAGRALSNTVGPEVVVDADAALIGLALRQLLDNALKYSAPAAAIEIGAVDADDSVEIAVRNAGSAILPHERDRIFERFYRGSRAGQVPGTGMGLAIVRQIARAHGGEASVSSEAGVTAFQLRLPRHGEGS
jgi:two-component system, OmpR family, sensor histidine kinase KdpD